MAEPLQSSERSLEHIGSRLSRSRRIPFRLRPLPRDSLSGAEHLVFFGRWLALAVGAIFAAVSYRLDDPNLLALLGAGFLYSSTLEVFARLTNRFRRWALLLSTPVDLLFVTWAAHSLEVRFASLYYIVVLIAAMRWGGWPTLLSGAASCVLLALIHFTDSTSHIFQPDVLIDMASLLGVAGLAGYLGQLNELERREKARMSDAERSKSDLVSLVSHELRTPLAMIKGAVDLLIDGSPGPVNQEQRTFLTTISDSCERLISLVEDLLAKAWVEAGKLELKRSPVDVRVPVRNAVRAFRPLAAQKRQDVHVDYPQVLSRMSADEYWIQQVVINLLSNASKYTSSGGHIYVAVAENQSHVLVSVTDDGAGISRAERERMFEPFFRGGQLSAPGTGLGLAIVQYVVEKHGGKVLVDTSIGQGTTVLFTLPK